MKTTAMPFSSNIVDRRTSVTPAGTGSSPSLTGSRSTPVGGISAVFGNLESQTPSEGTGGTTPRSSGGGSSGRVSSDAASGCWRKLARGWGGGGAQDADWDEGKHKRASNGQFGSGGGGRAPKKARGGYESDKPSGGSGAHSYNAGAVNKAIESSNRSGKRIGGKEAKLIHGLLRGRD